MRVESAPSATEVGCAQVLVSLPPEIERRERRQTTSQSTAAWGEGSTLVTLRCGVDPPGPTTQRCVTIGGVDWLLTTDGPGVPSRHVSFGRVPAVEVTVASGEGSDLALSLIGAAMEQIPVERACS